MNPNSAKFHHFDRHQGQTVAGLSSGISSARSQALTEHGSGGRFPFLSQQFRWTRTCHLGFRNTVGRLSLEEQAIHGHGIALALDGQFSYGEVGSAQRGAKPGFGRPCREAWCFGMVKRGGAEWWDDRPSEFFGIG